MKFKTISICAMALAMSLPAGALTLEEVGAKLRGVKCYRDSVSYEVLLASLAEPVTYTMQLESAEAKGDSLAPCKYVIKWSLPAPSGLARGFSAYFEGSHFRFRDKRLQEYHVSELADPFMPGGDVSRGVQMQVQFADLLPQFIGLQFERMASDPSYVTTVTADTLVSGKPSVVVDGVRRINGVDACEYTYILDGKTYLPVKTELENNPGQIGEQSISINYGVPTVKNCRIDLESLVESEPDAFGKYRENTFSLETLPGRPLPRIVAPTIDGSRYVHEREEAFEAPTVFVFLDATVGSTPQVIEDVRKGVDTFPCGCGVGISQPPRRRCGVVCERQTHRRERAYKRRRCSPRLRGRHNDSGTDIHRRRRACDRYHHRLQQVAALKRYTESNEF